MRDKQGGRGGDVDRYDVYSGLFGWSYKYELGVISMRDKQGKRGKRKITSSRRSLYLYLYAMLLIYIYIII